MVVKVYLTLSVSLTRGVNWSMLFQRLTQVAQQQVRHRTSLPFNTIILFVPQQEAWVVERFGKFQKVLSPVSNVSFVFHSRKRTSFVKLAQLGLDLFTQNQMNMRDYFSYGWCVNLKCFICFLGFTNSPLIVQVVSKK